MADSELEILIKLGVIGQADAQAARDLIKETGTTATAAGQAGENMGKGIAEAGEKGTHAAHGLFDSHREVHKLLHTIGNDAVPGMGQALGALAHGPLGAVIALGMAVEFVHKKIEETNKKLDEMAANASKAFGGGDWLTDYVKAATDAAIETENLAEALAKASNPGPEVKNRYETEAKAIGQVVEALEKKLKAQEADDLAEARKAGKESGASSEVMSATEAAIRAQYESRSNAAHDAADQALQEARQRELNERQASQEALNTEAASKTTPKDVSVSRSERIGQLEAEKAALGKATSELNTQANDELKETIEIKRSALERDRENGFNNPALLQEFQNEIDKLESETAEGRKERAAERIKQLSKQVIEENAAAAKEKAALEEATNAATENAKRVVDLQKEIADAHRGAEIKSKSAAELIEALQPYEDPKTFEKTAGVDTDAGAAAFIQKFLQAQSRLQQHQGTKDDSKMVGLLNSVLQVTNHSDQRTHDLLLALIKAKGDHAAAIGDLQSAAASAPRIKGSLTGN